MSVIHAPPKQEIDPKLIGAIGCAFFALSGVFVRLWYLQIVQGEEFLIKAARSGASRLDIMAPRGLMYDRRNRLVAGVRSEFVITGVPAVVNRNIWVLKRLADLTGADLTKLQKKLNDGYLRPNLPAPLYIGASVEVASKIAESGADFLPGIDVSNQPMRYYPNTTDMAHVLGYVGTPSPGDLKRLGKDLEGTDLRPATYVGKDGLEKTHELELMGAPGVENVVSAKKKAVRVVSKEGASPGKRLILTIDRDLQKLANELLEQSCRAHKSDGGAVVMIEPKTGEILCMATRPTFDAATFEGGASKDEYQALLDDPRKPLYNRALASYPPGSTFKIATAIAAARAGIFDPARSKYCPGFYQVGRQKFKCENHGAGTLPFMTAFSKSCNSYFGSWADVIGKETMCQTMLDLGFGNKTGVDLGGEYKGVVPTEEWLKSSCLLYTS
ncbi:MAG: penicillin-binding transpeptidase domain-containing protein, partial [Fimbriimonadaceae bacterium]